MTLYILYKNDVPIKTSFKLIELTNIIKKIRKTSHQDVYEIGKIERKNIEKKD